MSKNSKKAAIWIAFLAVAIVAFFCMTRTGKKTPLTEIADHIVVEKSAHTLSLYRQGNLLRTYTVALGRGGIGPKTRAGDNKVPEGTYRIVSHNAHSAFHRSLRVGYPTTEQVRAAHGANLGGDIMIHGIHNGLSWIDTFQRRVDWTKGCVAVTDDEIEEIYRTVPDGASIVSGPKRVTTIERMSPPLHDVLVIGAGPTGLACAIDAQNAGCSVVLIDKGCLTNSLFHYPAHMTFFTTPELLEIGNMPFSSPNQKPTRAEALEYYRKVAAHYHLDVRQYEIVSGITGADGDFSVHTN